ncbi:MAG TPA: GNAT family protein [Hyphomonadaceae bacterium]|nr:GNAT family protein [Hyphomonadaceae bacterium]
MSDLSGWTRRQTPGLVPLAGRVARLEPLDWSVHGDGVFAAVGGEGNSAIWTWMPVGPFATPEDLRAMLARNREDEGWRTMAIRSAASGEILGMATYMRIREGHGSAEIGCVAFGPKLKRTAIATEAFALMAGHVFDDLGYRRYEWKCNSLNEASKRAAERFGFAFEGTFRNDMVAKGKSRDTAWYAILDAEWPILRAALAAWLAPDNFGPDGGQVATLESFRRTT